MSENLRVIRFAIIICVACSLLVSSSAIVLHDRQVGAGIQQRGHHRATQVVG